MNDVFGHFLVLSSISLINCTETTERTYLGWVLTVIHTQAILIGQWHFFVICNVKMLYEDDEIIILCDFAQDPPNDPCIFGSDACNWRIMYENFMNTTFCIFRKNSKNDLQTLYIYDSANTIPGFATLSRLVCQYPWITMHKCIINEIPFWVSVVQKSGIVFMWCVIYFDILKFNLTYSFCSNLIRFFNPQFHTNMISNVYYSYLLE